MLSILNFDFLFCFSLIQQLGLEPSGTDFADCQRCSALLMGREETFRHTQSVPYLKEVSVVTMPLVRIFAEAQRLRREPSYIHFNTMIHSRTAMTKSAPPIIAAAHSFGVRVFIDGRTWAIAV